MHLLSGMSDDSSLPVTGTEDYQWLDSQYYILNQNIGHDDWPISVVLFAMLVLFGRITRMCHVDIHVCVKR